MKLAGKALRLTIFIGESDQRHHRPVFSEVVHRAHAFGMAGASVMRGIEGFGATSHIHTSGRFRLSGDLPMAIVIVDTDERIRGSPPAIDELVEEGVVDLDPVDVVNYVGRPAKESSA